MSERCPECARDAVKRVVEMIREPVKGRTIFYSTFYHACLASDCKTTWYGVRDMREQMANRQHAMER